MTLGLLLALAVEKPMTQRVTHLSPVGEAHAVLSLHPWVFFKTRLRAITMNGESQAAPRGPLRPT